MVYSKRLIFYEKMSEQQPLLNINSHIPEEGYQNSHSECGNVRGGKLPSNSERVVRSGNNQASDPFYEGLVSFVGGIFGCIGSYVCCCCNPYTTVNQGHELVVTRFGRYKDTLSPGYHYLRPLTDRGYSVSKMTRVIDLPAQSILTKDNVTAIIDGSVYYKIVDSYTTTFTITGLQSCLNQLALSALRACFANHTLQDSLEHRDRLAAEIQEYIIEHTGEWGIEVSSTVIKDIKLSEDMQHHLSAKANAEREAAAKVIEAHGDVEAAKLFRQAADTLNTPAAIQIRYLETLKAMASNPGTRVMFVPLGVTDNITRITAAVEAVQQ